jgi:small subunit ribosomal protein S2
MAPYIYGKRRLIHIIDLMETVKGYIRAFKFLAKITVRGDEVLFVGTKRQAKATVREESQRCGMPYVAERWLGGTLTNFQTISSRIKHLEELEGLEARAEEEKLTKKDLARIRREKRKMLRNLEGIRNIKRLPEALVIVDPKREHISVREARKLGIPVICLLDTDCDPSLVDISVPGNDDAMRSIQIFVRKMADAVMQGRRAFQDVLDQAEREKKKAEEKKASASGRRKSDASAKKTQAAGEQEAPAPAAAADKAGKAQDDKQAAGQ